MGTQTLKYLWLIYVVHNMCWNVTNPMFFCFFSSIGAVADRTDYPLFNQHLGRLDDKSNDESSLVEHRVAGQLVHEHMAP